MLKIQNINDLQTLVTDAVPESLTLEYKSSAALGKQNTQKNELIKDVSSFANSAGGQIIYGIVEKNHKPIEIDSGTDLSREWLEQVIDTNIQPRIEGLNITPILISENKFAYILNIPQAVGRAPHQAEHKYYKRSNFQSVPMDDYEIRDIFRRARAPQLHCALHFGSDLTQSQIIFSDGKDTSDPILFGGTLINDSPEPAYYSVFSLYLDNRIDITKTGDFGQFSDAFLNTGQKIKYTTKNFGLPGYFPIFKEARFDLSAIPIYISIRKIFFA